MGDEPINILIVDDEPSNLVVLETVLDDPGYRLVRAQTADQALLALMEREFALLILDIRLPGMSGFELAQLIKQRKKTAGVPIIFLTAYYDKDQHVLEGYGTGAVDFLNKPVNPAVLRSKVSVFADLHRKNRAITLANSALMIEVAERRRAQEQLRELNETLERQVVERTEALRKADHKLRALMESITDGLVTLDGDWRFSYCNEQGARLLGTPVGRLVGGCIWEIFPSLRSTAFEHGLRRAVSSRQTVSFEEFFPEPLGIWFGCHCYPSDEGLSVYFHDVTDRHEVEVRREQLLAAEQAARAEGERVARARDEFLASLSHELRTPLAAIVGWSTVLERSEFDDPTVRRGVEAIARNARAQAQLVDDLLDMSRIVSGKMRLHIERVDLGMLAAAAADAMRAAFQAKGVGIDLQLADARSTEIMADTVRLHQIVSNLLSNALKFTPAGGMVTIATFASESHVELSVADTGEGIEPGFLPHLFERFTQADGSAARVHGGLGLGLSIVKNLVELQAGTVTASSAGRQQGSTLRVQFARAPRLGEEQAGPAPSTTAGRRGLEALDRAQAAHEGSTDLQGVSVLLVEDHADMLDLECRLLGDCGATVTTASSAEEALTLLRSRPFDVLLSDLGLPGMDGYELIETVRSALGIGAEHMPAAAVTAFVRAEDLQRALLAGYQACILKPLDPANLTRTVFELARRPDAASQKSDTAGLHVRHGSSDGVPATDASILNAFEVMPQAGRLRVLFVEDNSDLREQIGWMLQEAQLDLVSCASGEEAEIEFAKGGYDLLLTDVSLPGMSGLELARRVLAESPQAWVAFSTGYPLADNLSEIGPHVRALLKPFEIDDLRLLVNEVRAERNRGGSAEP